MRNKTLTPVTVERCWMKAGILLPHQVDSMCEKPGIKYSRKYYRTPGVSAGWALAGFENKEVYKETNEGNGLEEGPIEGVSKILTGVMEQTNKNGSSKVNKVIMDVLT